MRSYTERYNAARQSGAKPLILAEVWTDKGPRVFGKQTPTEDQAQDIQLVYIGGEQVYIGSEAVGIAATTGGPFEWSARVLSFGDFRQALSENSDNAFQSITEKLMENYTLTLDNADQFFTALVAKEQFLNGKIYLRQGFDYPGFTQSDFITLFYGKITNYDFGYLDFVINADQAIEAKQPDDPTIDITKTYALAVDGAGFTGATEEYTYSELEDVFYTETTWTETFDILLDSADEQTIFEIENQAYGVNRWEFGIDGSGYLYFKYTDDIDTATPTFQTITSDIQPTVGVPIRVRVDVDQDAGEINFEDSEGNTYTHLFSVELEFSSKFGVFGSGDGQWSSPFAFDLNASGQIVAADRVNDRIQIVTTSGAFVAKFGTYGSGFSQFVRPEGIAVHPNGNIYVSDTGNDRIQVFDSSGSFLFAFGSSGSGNREFNSPVQIAFNSENNLYIVDRSNHRIQVTTDTGVFVEKYGSNGSGDGFFNNPRDIAIDTDGNIYVADWVNSRVQKFSSSWGFLGKFTVPGSARALSVCVGANGDVYATTEYTDLIYHWDSGGSVLETFGGPGTGDGQFYNPHAIRIFDIGFITADTDNNRFQILDLNIIGIDYTDNGSDDIVGCGRDFTGMIRNVRHSTDTELLSLLNQTDNTAIAFDDVEGDLDLSLVDGYWEEWGTIEEITSELIEETTLTAFEEVILRTAGDYANPGSNQSNLILPLPYGNLLENSGSGVWVCPLIDSVNYVYCVAGWPILSVADGNNIIVFVDGGFTGTGYTFDESNDYEGQGDIAILTFAVDQGDATITVMARGKETTPGSGVLITNPIDIIDDWMEYAATQIGSATWQKDTTTFVTAAALCDEYGYTGAGVIQANNTLGFWVQSILNSFLGYFRFDIDGRLQVFITPQMQDPNVQEWLDEYEELSLRIKEDIENVINRVIINYAIAYTKIDRRFKDGGESNYFLTADVSCTEQSAQQYGERIQRFDFDWTRSTQTVNTCILIIFDRYGFPELILSYEGQDFRWMPLEIGDEFEATISLVCDTDGTPVQDVQYRLLEKTQNLDTFTTTLTASSIGYRRNLTSHSVYIGTDQVYIGGEEVKIGA